MGEWGVVGGWVLVGGCEWCGWVWVAGCMDGRERTMTRRPYLHSSKEGRVMREAEEEEREGG